MPRYSVSNLFIPTSNCSFSSAIFAKYTCATGVFLNEDLDYLLRDVSKFMQFFFGKSLVDMK